MPESVRELEHHLSDCDLLLTIDGELPADRQRLVAAHLSGCSECRERQAQIHRAAGCFETVRYADAGIDQARHRLARARLCSSLNDASERWRGPLRERVFAAAATSSWTTIGAIATAAALCLLLLNPVIVDRRAHVSPLGSDALPVAALTPGATWSLSLTDLCRPGAREQRQVPLSVRQQVLRDYGMESVPRDQYELDYLITPELGGAPHPRNLWPQRYSSPVWNAQVKDQLEQLLPRLVCDRRVILETAQHDIAVDWIAAYKKYFHTDVPIQTHALTDARGGEVLDDDITYPVWRASGAPRLISFSVRR
jgi:anti-sigma factor RsiW